jgi:hypothetical protein
MKRHLSLRKFSDDHHGGLVQARRLRRVAAGEEGSPTEAARSFIDPELQGAEGTAVKAKKRPA